MKKASWSQYIPWILLCEAVGILSGLLSMDGMRIYNETAVKPPLSPPPIVFPIVWTILFALMGIGIARIRRKRSTPGAGVAQNIFFIQLIVNFFWPLFFFNARVYGFALVWILLLWILIVVMILRFLKIDKTAAFLQVPYLLWVTFAAYLNYMVSQLN